MGEDLSANLQSYQMQLQQVIKYELFYSDNFKVCLNEVIFYPSYF